MTSRFLDENELRSALAPLRFLIADSSTGRKSLRRLLSYFGVKPHQCEVIENLSDAAEHVRARKPHVIFADQDLGEPGGLTLLEIHKSVLMEGEIRAFFLLTSKDSPVVTSGAAEENVDAVLLKPFTFKALLTQFTEVLSAKLRPTPYQLAMAAGTASFERGEMEPALNEFRTARRLDTQSALAWYWEGRVLEKSDKAEEAIAAFESGLSMQGTHFRCLTGLIDALILRGGHERAYEVARILAQAHSIPMKLMPTLIRLSVHNQKFADVLGFHESAKAMAEIDPRSSTYLAAGLVVCGLHFLREEDRHQALDAFRKAEGAARGSARILRRILVELRSNGFDSEMKSMLARLPAEIRNSPEVRMAELEHLDRIDGSVASILILANQLHQEGVQSEALFRIILKRSLEAGRKPTHVLELLAHAIECFPECKDEFESLVPIMDGSVHEH